ncbi:hypothetical protein TFKS16_2363 [Tannerella forsythia KS16]|uniref:Uncharacterized protein n=1 Tax=Tannerella forsythia (strain ATCC 43037 / JCM 10827 / CCUG 21028 A / KCTC 5666 / FDC 338) TaxID=203275 RepID=G8ULS2_TANFA|nr:hypothetical protein BFO_2631 [Tannerella forsythia 92A2]BAR49747.1 hypothetical protein TF3313_2299 [Tannerella forsythia 3313]BAR52557.1 hypothetical protein TFKS16_2363 [Tannerella forsythia KS16]
MAGRILALSCAFPLRRKIGKHYATIFQEIMTGVSLLFTDG